MTNSVVHNSLTAVIKKYHTRKKGSLLRKIWAYIADNNHGLLQGTAVVWTLKDKSIIDTTDQVKIDREQTIQFILNVYLQEINVKIEYYKLDTQGLLMRSISTHNL